MTPDDFVQHYRDARASAILRTDDESTAAPAMDAVIAAGFRIVEFTLTIPGVLDRLREYGGREDVIVGAGTVMNEQDAHAAVEAGAQFLVSPVVDERVIATASQLGAAMMPGAHTPTEMMRAHDAGAQLVKLFPAPGTGPTYVKSILGPLPFLKIVPTNGVHLNNAASFLKAGAWAVGFTTALFDANDLNQGNYNAIEERGRKLLHAINEELT